MGCVPQSKTVLLLISERLKEAQCPFDIPCTEGDTYSVSTSSCKCVFRRTVLISIETSLSRALVRLYFKKLSAVLKCNKGCLRNIGGKITKVGFFEYAIPLY